MSSSKKIYSIVLMIMALLLVQCSSDHPKRFIKKETYAQILSEMMTIQYLNASDKEKAILLKNVLEKYHITKAQFDSTRIHYGQDPSFWEDVFKRVKLKLEKKLAIRQRKNRQP